MNFYSNRILQCLKISKSLILLFLTTAFMSNCETLIADANESSDVLKIGSLLPTTGDLSPGGQAMTATVVLLVDTVNQCGGVNGKPVELLVADDETDPTKGNQAMTQLVEVDKVAGVVGSFASSVTASAIDVAVRNKVMLISPGSTSPVFTERSKREDFKYEGINYWARTVSSDIYQSKVLAKLAYAKGFRKVSTVVVNNDYGINFERVFTQSFKKLGGIVIDEKNPTRYNLNSRSYNRQAYNAFSKKPDAVLGVFYAEPGALFLNSAYKQGLTKDIQILLTDGVESDDFAAQVGRKKTGQFIIEGAIGTRPGADGKGLPALLRLWEEKKQIPIPFLTYVATTWDATALLILAAEAAKANTGEAIANKIREVSNPPGIEVSDVCEGLKLLRAGRKINYQGASGNVDIDAYGDVREVYDFWQVQQNGTIKTVGKVKP